MKVSIIEGVLYVTPETEAEYEELKFWEISNVRQIGEAKAYCAKSIQVNEDAPINIKEHMKNWMRNRL